MTAVDWLRPIEAAHEDGRVLSVKAVGTRMRTVEPHLEDNGLSVGFFRSDGTHKNPRIRWRIRNVQPTTPERDPALWDRMEALVRSVAQYVPEAFTEVREARAIVADLPKPVDPDEQYARDLIAAQGWSGEKSIGDAAVLAMIAKAHREGRRLAGERA